MKAGWCLDGLHGKCRSTVCSCPCGPHPRALPASPSLTVARDVAWGPAAAVVARPRVISSSRRRR